MIISLTPRHPKGPHLNALRAFEAAARLGSFTAAAEELSITLGAVTQHIKTLEAWAETQLFIRNARGFKLTPLAEELLPGFTQAFDQLGFSVHALRNKAMPQKIKVAALPAIAQLWLAPRLGQLREVVPEISVSVVAMDTPPNLARDLLIWPCFSQRILLAKMKSKSPVIAFFPFARPQWRSG